ncbi:uncharacterized protein LOC135398251 [Ornithodoros turicata]|uniref:uncharacterized protein LOC135398251 n=1 Tax=Ornithodoros turicata TaxID=34597 RepID=UPI003139BA08
MRKRRTTQNQFETPSSRTLFNKMKLFLVYLTVLAVGLSSTYAASTGKPDCDESILDQCGTGLFFFAKSTKVAGNAEELAKACKDEMKDLDCVQNYANACLTGLARGMVQLLLDGCSKVISEKCVPGSPKHAQYLDNVDCLNKAGDKIHPCMNQLSAVLEASSEHPEGKHKVGLACCSFSDYQQCILNASRSTCTESHTAYAGEIIQSYAGDLLDTVCVRYKSGSPACSSLPALHPPKKARSQSLLPPLAAILRTLG